MQLLHLSDFHYSGKAYLCHKRGASNLVVSGIELELLYDFLYSTLYQLLADDMIDIRVQAEISAFVIRMHDKSETKI